MSKILKLNIIRELDNCCEATDINNVRSKYSTAFQNAVDATEFNRLVKEYEIKLTHSK